MRNNAEKVAAITACIKNIKEVTNSSSPVKVSITPILQKHRVANELLGVLKNMEILKFERVDNKSTYQWNFGAGHIDAKLANAVYDEVKKIQNSRPNKKPLNVKTTIPVKEEVEAEVKTSKKLVSEIREKAPKVVFTDKMGTIFGYKQLEYIGTMTRKLPTSVVIDHNLTIENVKHIHYNIEGSNIAITFYNDFGDMSSEPMAKIAQIRMTNKVIGLKEHGGDTQSSILMMNCISVTNPYTIH